MRTTLQRRRVFHGRRFEFLDFLLICFLTAWGVAILVPFYNLIVTSFTTQKEFLMSPVILFPAEPTLKNYASLFEDGRIWVGYRTTLIFLGIGMPLNMFLTTSMAYAMSRLHFPGRRLFFLVILFTMIFNGGIIPLYLVMKELGLTNRIWSVILGYGMNTFYMIIMMNYYRTIPDSLMEAARLDGASEWSILFRVVIPLSLPIIATITLFYSVDRWNEWFNALIFIRRSAIVPLQLVLRTIVIDSQVLQQIQSSGLVSIEDQNFATGMKMAAVMVTMLPVMCVFPFLQKHFVKGMLIGAIKA
jgi:putative aldouronate transport system permease protein